MVSQIGGLLIALTVLFAIELLILVFIALDFDRTSRYDHLDLKEIHSARNFAFLGLIILVISSIVGRVLVYNFLSDLQQSASSEEELLNAIDRAQSGGILPNLISIIGYIFLGLSTIHFHNYIIGKVADKFSHTNFYDANDGISFLRYSYFIFALIEFVDIFPGDSLSSILGLVAIVVQLYG